MAKKGKENKSKSSFYPDTSTAPNKNQIQQQHPEDDEIHDSRFTAAQTHPQFRFHTRNKKVKSFESVTENTSKEGGELLSSGDLENVEIDERFQSIHTDERFAIGGSGGIDSRYGSNAKKKKKDGKKKGKKEKKVREESDDGENDENVNDKSKVDNEVDNDGDEHVNSETNLLEDDDDKRGDEMDGTNGVMNQDMESRIAYLTALSRGEISGSDSSSSNDENDSSSDEDGQNDDDSSTTTSNTSSSSEDSIYGKAGILDPSSKHGDSNIENTEIEMTHTPSPYLAVCNMDWTHVRAVDILAILGSFSPPGSVEWVRVYPSDFGMERMKAEEVSGPVGIWKKTKKVKKEESRGDGNSNVAIEENEVEKYDSDDDEEGDQSASGSDNRQERPSSDYHSDDDVEDETTILNKQYRHFQSQQSNNSSEMESDYDPEKLRAYEASKLKYYFAIVKFTSPEAADVVYKEVDGMEVGHSSATIDLRSVPPPDLESVVEGRAIRDQISSVVPSNYNPPDFVVAALQQTTVKCTWEEGDAERERLLTQYGVGNEAWAAMTEGDDLKAYLASDVSSSEEEESDEEEEDENGRVKKTKHKKGSQIRKLLGLDSGEEDDNNSDRGSDEDCTSSSHEFPTFDGSSDSDADNRKDRNVQVATFIPGNRGLEDKIRLKIEAKKMANDRNAKKAKELTPWEKYQLKRKEKRKERKQAARERINDPDSNIENIRSGKQISFEFNEKSHDRISVGDEEGGLDDFFAEEGSKKSSKKTKKGVTGTSTEHHRDVPSTKEELNLLLAGDDDEEIAKDYDMRGLMRINKNRDKKLRGSRKRKEAEIAANVSGTEFKIDTTDERFAALLEGNDERFGIDRTDPQYKETPAMNEVLAEQTKRRNAKKRAKIEVGDINADSVEVGGSPSSGALALSSLVKSLKQNLVKNHK